MENKKELKGQAGLQDEGQEPEEQAEDLEELPIDTSNSLLPSLSMRIKGIGGITLELSASGFTADEAAALFDYGISKYQKLTGEQPPKGKPEKQPYFG